MSDEDVRKLKVETDYKLARFDTLCHTILYAIAFIGLATIIIVAKLCG